MTADISLATDIAGIRMKNPVMVASGTFGYGPEYADLVDLNALGAIVVKGICLQPTKGNRTPRTVETASGLINAIGLPGPGVDGFVKTYMPFLRRYDVPVLVNIWGRTIEEYAEVAARLDAVDGIAGLEVNLSCPNIKEGSAVFGADLDMFRRCLDAVRVKTKRPLIPKLAPNVSDIAAFARAAEAEGVILRPADEFAAPGIRAPNAVRLALAGRAPWPDFTAALDRLARLLQRPPQEAEV